jgi:hypothetical protein
MGKKTQEQLSEIIALVELIASAHHPVYRVFLVSLMASNALRIENA